MKRLSPSSFFVVRLLLAVVVIVVTRAVSASAQTPPRPGSVRITVRDATRLPIANARVVAVSSSGTERAASTNDAGIADVEGLLPGSYVLRISSDGFDSLTLEGITVRAGARTTREVELRIAGFVDQVDVSPVDADRQLDQAFNTDLSADEILALPEDPDELAAVLALLAGDDAEIRVDGFLDGTLPPGTQIQSVRIRYDAASANSSTGGPRIEIRTQPGGDRWRSNASFRVRDEALNARNAFAPERPEGQARNYSWTLSGPIVKNRTGLSLTVDRSDAIDQQATRAVTPDGIEAHLLHQPVARYSVSGRIEHALTPAQRLRIEFRQSNEHASLQGIGELDLPERSYEREAQDGELHVSHNAMLARQMVHDIRLQVRWRDSDAIPVTTATALRVSGAFSSGGAQYQGGRRSREIEFEDELLFPVGKRHQVTAGVSVIGGQYAGDEWRNAGGTFTFATLDDFTAGRATTFTQRQGDPSFDYSLYRFGAWVQEDFHVRRNLMLNLGVRHEFQTHLNDWNNVAPRLGVNWTPVAHWRTTLRAGYSVSFQPFMGSTYEQTILVDGERQRDIVISAPSYPNPYDNGALPSSLPPGIIRSDPGLTTPTNRRWSVGIDQPIRKAARVRATYSRQTGHDLFRSVDVNAPVDGVRPDPTARNITELRSIAESLNHSLELSLSLTYPHGFNVKTTYVLGRAENETDGALTLPPDSFNLEQEWGPSRGDVRHRFDVSVNRDLWFGVRINGNAHLQSASPYNITTGVDSNGDGATNERPQGVGRNSARGSGTKVMDLTLTWGFGLGHRALPPPPTTPRGRVGGALAASPRTASPRARFELYVQGGNVLNFVNYQGYSGVVTSPFFGQPTSASAPRRLSLGARVFF